MSHSSDTTAAGDGGSFSPEQAAALLDQTTQQARRKFQSSPPWLLTTRAILVLAALGAIWLSVRGQHPYQGPTAADIPVLVVFIVLNFAATVGIRRRAITGISGQTPFSPAEIIALVAAFAATVALMAGLYSTVSFADYPSSVLVIPGLVWAAISALRSRSLGVATGLTLLAIGIVGAFAGAAGSWAVTAVGLCLLLLGNAVAVARQQQA